LVALGCCDWLLSRRLVGFSENKIRILINRLKNLIKKFQN
jgi:hypothetical protein